ncbi:MAG TPA: putative sulfate exporter family transporter, partial [Edaphobacter sp.]|nr:putative sulfate exporter family transporter [Edaphobacter sp.]
MATSANLPNLRTEYPPHSPGSGPAERSTFLGLLPGIALLFVVGYAGKFVEHFLNTWTKAHHITFPNIEYVLWAILFGILIANTVGVPRIFRAGVATYDFWLKTGIILLGARFILGDVLKLGGISLLLVFIAFAFSLTFMTWLGRTFNLNPKLTTLLAVGSSVCGVSAIIATQGAIDADEEDSSTAIAAILALGALSLFTFPLIGHALHMSDHAYGIWAGLAVDNTAEATAAGALYSDAAGKFAVLAKTCRNALIGHALHMSDHAYGLWAGLAVDNTAEATAAGALFSDATGKYA